MATAVAQVFLALPSDRTQWSKIGTGVVCFVKDKAEKSFFIRMLDIKVCILLDELSAAFVNSTVFLQFLLRLADYVHYYTRKNACSVTAFNSTDIRSVQDNVATPVTAMMVRLYQH